MLTERKINFLNLCVKPKNCEMGERAEAKKKKRESRKNKYIETQTNTWNIQPGFSVCIMYRVYAQHIDYANFHYTLKSNGIAWLCLACVHFYVARWKFSTLFRFAQRRKIGSCVLCAPATCMSVCVFTQVDWTFNTHTTRISRHNHFISSYLPHSFSTRFFLSFFALVTPASEVQTSVCRLLGSLHGIFYIYFRIQYEIANLFPCFNLGVICCLVWRIDRAACITLCAQYVCLCKIVCVFVLICRKVNHRLWKHGL